MFQNEFGSCALDWGSDFDLPSFLTTATADDGANTTDDDEEEDDDIESRNQKIGKDDKFHSEWVDMLPPLAKPPPGCDLYGINLDDPESMICHRVDVSRPVPTYS